MQIRVNNTPSCVSFVLLVLLVVLSVMFVSPEVVSAQEEEGGAGIGVIDYFLLTPISGFVTEDEAADLGKFINAFVRLAIAIATGLAVVMVVIGGVTYMVTGSISKKANGREMINDALFGLVLALAAFLILQTVNKDLVKLDFVTALDKVGALAAQQTKPGPLVDVDSLPPETSEEEATLRIALEIEPYPVDVADNKPPCPPGGPYSNCLLVEGLPFYVINDLKVLKRSCDEYTVSCDIVLTGGSEPHKTHREGEPFVDIALDNEFDFFIENGRNASLEVKNGFPLYTIGPDQFWKEGDHWHVCFGKPCVFANN